MSEWGDGPPEIEPDIAIIQARQRGPTTSPGSGQLPTTDFVGSLNGLGGALTLQPGTVSSGVTVSFTQGAGTISFNMSGFGPLATAKCNVQVGDPTAADDSSAGYAQFSLWINTAGPKIYICADASVGAADWQPVNF